MKTSCSILFLLLVFIKSYGQKYDKVWAVGTPVGTMAFEGDSVVSGNLQDSTTLSFETLGSICDSNGNFLLYSNGLAVYNRYGHIMPHGDSLNYPSVYYQLEVPQGEASAQGMVILPYPDSANKYLMVHYIGTDTLTSDGGYESTTLRYSVIDMTLDSGRGDLTEKNIVLMQGEVLSSSRIAAVRHANGRDWWIIKPAWYENIYYRFLLTPNGISGGDTQKIGPRYGLNNEFHAYSLFNSDGSKYASVTPVGHVVVMDFDRCTGLFSNADSIYNNDSSDPLHDHISGGGGLAFSPSGRYLYVGNPIELNQYDLSMRPLRDSIRINTDTEFYQMNMMQLAPNGKMYVSCWGGGSYAMHVINNPDSLGRACDFRQFNQPTLTQSPVGIPYFPNFKLGALIGSGCDTITGLQPIPSPSAMAKIEPNPASTIATIVYSDDHSQSNKVDVYNMLGELVLSKTDLMDAGKIEINVSNLPTGIYMLRMVSDGLVLLNTKFVVSH